MADDGGDEFADFEWSLGGEVHGWAHHAAGAGSGSSSSDSPGVDYACDHLGW